MSYLLTWNDHTTCHDETVAEAVREAQKLPEDSRQLRHAVARIGDMPSVVAARDAFLTWWKKHSKEEWHEESYQHECSLHAKEPGLLHHHVTVSRLAFYERAVLFSNKKEFAYQGIVPDVEWNKAKGMTAVKSVHRSHAYCQVRII